MWLNKWERNFGAECSSIMFELPHFALELLFVLPLCQIVTGRLKIVGHPHFRGVVPGRGAAAARDNPENRHHGGDGQDAAAAAAANVNNNNDNERDDSLVPDVLHCAWIRDSSQRHLFPRLRANIRIMAMIFLITSVAAFNALVVPLTLENHAVAVPRSKLILEYSNELAVLMHGAAVANAVKSRSLQLERSLLSSPSASTVSSGMAAVSSWLSFSGSKRANKTDNNSDHGNGSLYARNTTSKTGITSSHVTGIKQASWVNSTVLSCMDGSHCGSIVQRQLLAALMHRGILQKKETPLPGVATGARVKNSSSTDDLRSRSDAQGATMATKDPLQALFDGYIVHDDTLLVPGEWILGALHLLGDLEAHKGASSSLQYAVLMMMQKKDRPSSLPGKQYYDFSSVSARKMMTLLIFDDNHNGSTDGDESGSDAKANAGKTSRSLKASVQEMRRLQASYLRAVDVSMHRGSYSLAADDDDDNDNTNNNNNTDGVRADMAPGGSSSDASSSYYFKTMPTLYKILHKHSSELLRMDDTEHKQLVPLVELALAIMRLSCERWFALVAVYLGYLLYLDPPAEARTVIRFISRISQAFQKAILLSFPGVCWTYGAGVLFSSFASVIFWGGPIMRAIEQLRTAATAVQPRSWHVATPLEIERMGGTCAICWSSLQEGSGDDEGGQDDEAVGQRDGGGTGSQGVVGLPCSHAYHRQCLLEWLGACYGYVCYIYMVVYELFCTA